MSNSCPKHLKCLRMLCVSICIWDNGQVRLAWSWRSLEIGYHLKIWCFSIDGVTEQQYEKSEGYGLICWLRYHSSCIFSLIAQILKCFKCTEKSRHSQKKASPNYQESEFQNKKKAYRIPTYHRKFSSLGFNSPSRCASGLCCPLGSRRREDQTWRYLSHPTPECICPSVY